MKNLNMLNINEGEVGAQENPVDLNRIVDVQTLKTESLIKPEDERFFTGDSKLSRALRAGLLGLTLFLSEGCGRSNKVTKEPGSTPAARDVDKGKSKGKGFSRVFIADDGHSYKIVVGDDNELKDFSRIEPAAHEMPKLKEYPKAPEKAPEKAEVKKEEHPDVAAEKKPKTAEQNAAEKEAWEKTKQEKLKAAREYLEKLDYKYEDKPRVKIEKKKTAETLEEVEKEHLDKDVHLKMHDAEEKAIHNKPKPFNNYYQ